MPGFTPAAKDLMLEAMRSALTQVSLHSGDPGTTGAAELSGGDYARQNVTIGAASGGEMFVTNEPSFEVPPSATVAYIGVWEGTTFRGSSSVTNEVYSTEGGTFKVLNTTRFDLNG